MTFGSFSGVTYGTAAAIAASGQSSLAGAVSSQPAQSSLNGRSYSLSPSGPAVERTEQAISIAPPFFKVKYSKDRYPRIFEILYDVTPLPKELCQMVVCFTDAIETPIFSLEKHFTSTCYSLVRAAQVLPDGALWQFISIANRDRKRPEFTLKELDQSIDILADGKKVQSLRQLFTTKLYFDLYDEGPHTTQSNVNVFDIFSSQHLHALCRSGCVELVDLALSSTDTPLTNLHFCSAYKSKNPDLLRFLDNCVVKKRMDHDYNSLCLIIHSAAQTRSFELFSHAYEKFIRPLGIEIDARDPTGKTLAYYVASSGSVAMLKALRKLGADFSIKSLGNSSIFHQAATNPDVSVLAYLYSDQLNLRHLFDEVNSLADSPLAFAVSFGLLYPVKFFVINGAVIRPKIFAEAERNRTISPAFEQIYNFLVDHRG